MENEIEWRERWSWLSRAPLSTKLQSFLHLLWLQKLPFSSRDPDATCCPRCSHPTNCRHLTGECAALQPAAEALKNKWLEWTNTHTPALSFSETWVPPTQRNQDQLMLALTTLKYTLWLDYCQAQFSQQPPANTTTLLNQWQQLLLLSIPLAKEQKPLVDWTLNSHWNP